MNRNKLAAFVAGAALAATAAGCQRTENTNANGNTVNSNTGVVTNNNGNTNTAGVTTTNTANSNYTATRGNYNANITREEYDRERDRYGREARDAGRTVGTGVNDGWIWTKARATLATENDLRDSTVNVDVDNGVVTLTGTVANQSQKTRAQTVVNALDGVKSVKNNLQVSGAGGNTNMNSNTR